MKNKYKVPVKLWNSFKSNAAKNTFNQNYENWIKHQPLINCSLNNLSFTHSQIPEKQWKTICWNMACDSAWQTDKEINTIKNNL